MSSRKSQNSILFLATLGVYLGLVLTGATPVLGHAATSRQFDIRDEIEFADEFDNKPEGEELKAFLENELETSVSRFVRDLRDLTSKETNIITGNESYSIHSVRYFCSENRIEDQNSVVRSAWFAAPFTDLHKNLYVAANWQFNDLPSFIKRPTERKGLGFCKNFGTDVELNSKEISVKISFSRESELDAFNLAGVLNEYFFERTDLQQDPLTKQLYQYTRATSSYTDLFVITRLPRAGLELLLANDAK